MVYVPLTKSQQKLACLLVTVLFIFYVTYSVVHYPSNDQLQYGENNELVSSRIIYLTQNTYATEASGKPWPPENLSDLIDSETGRFELSLKPSVMPKEFSRSVYDIYYTTLKTLYKGPALSGSELRQFEMMKKNLGVGSEFPYYDMYPLSMDMREAVRAVKSGLPVRKPPINNPKLYVIKSPNKVCNSPRRGDNSSEAYPFDLLIFVKSCVGCTKERAHCRNTYMQPHLWGNFRVGFVFVVGQLVVDRRRWININGLNLQVKPIWNEKERHEKHESLMNESTVYQDVLIGDFIDSYYNLTLKVMFTFRWASIFCRKQSRLFMLVDHDMSMIPQHLINLIRTLPNEAQAYFNGGMLSPRRVHRPSLFVRSNRWDITTDEFPWDQYPPYLMGPVCMLGERIILDSSIAMAFTRQFRLEDVYRGIVLQKLNYPTVNVPGFKFVVSSKADVPDTVIAHKVNINRYMDWNTGKVNV